MDRHAARIREAAKAPEPNPFWRHYPEFNPLVFATREEAVASVLERLDREVAQAEANLKAAKRRAANARRKFGHTPDSQTGGT